MKQIKKCPYGSKIIWKTWIPVPGIEYKYLECTKERCNHGDWDCCSEYFEKEEDVIIDWNRKMNKKQGGK